MSDTPTVIPALEENLNPKSFILSNIIDVSVMLNRLKTSAMIFPKKFLLNGSMRGCSSKYAFNPPSPNSVAETKYLSGVLFSRLYFVGSLIYANESGMISLKITYQQMLLKFYDFALL